MSLAFCLLLQLTLSPHGRVCGNYDTRHSMQSTWNRLNSTRCVAKGDNEWCSTQPTSSSKARRLLALHKKQPTRRTMVAMCSKGWLRWQARSRKAKSFRWLVWAICGLAQRPTPSCSCSAANLLNSMRSTEEIQSTSWNLSSTKGSVSNCIAMNLALP